MWCIMKTATGVQRSDLWWIIKSYYLAFSQWEGWAQRSLRGRIEVSALGVRMFTHLVATGLTLSSEPRASTQEAPEGSKSTVISQSW